MTQPSSNSPVVVAAALDGARVLWRLWYSNRAPAEGWVREFSPTKEMVRMANSDRETDAGTWYRTRDIRVEAVLEPGKAPKRIEAKPAHAEEEL